MRSDVSLDVRFRMVVAITDLFIHNQFPLCYCLLLADGKTIPKIPVSLTACAISSGFTVCRSTPREGFKNWTGMDRLILCVTCGN